MIKICQPYIEIVDEKAYLKAECVQSDSEETKTIWYAVDNKYRNYLVTEVADCFLLAILGYALRKGQDIASEAPISEKLLYHVKNGLIEMFAVSLSDGRPIYVEAEPSALVFDAPAVATGCSLGVDSFAAILKNINGDTPPGYRLTHICLSNTGHFGDDDTDTARKDFFNVVNNLSDVSKELNLELVWIDSNISDLYKEIDLHFISTLVERTVSAPMCLQKLLGKYLVASSFPALLSNLQSDDSDEAINITVPLMSTNSMETVVATPMMTRIDKIKYISDFPLVRKYLDVCWYYRIKNMNREFAFSLDRSKKNCGKCGKCLRTLLTFELLGKIGDYEQLFDLDAYYKHKNKYLIKVLAERDDIPYNINSEVYHLLKEKNYSVPIYVRAAALAVRIGILNILPRKLFAKIISR